MSFVVAAPKGTCNIKKNSPSKLKSQSALPSKSRSKFRNLIKTNSPDAAYAFDRCRAIFWLNHTQNEAPINPVAVRAGQEIRCPKVPYHPRPIGGMPSFVSRPPTAGENKGTQKNILWNSAARGHTTGGPAVILALGKIYAVFSFFQPRPSLAFRLNQRSSFHISELSIEYIVL